MSTDFFIVESPTGTLLPSTMATTRTGARKLGAEFRGTLDGRALSWNDVANLGYTVVRVTVRKVSDPSRYRSRRRTSA